MYKILGVVLLIILSLTILAGCFENEEEPTQQQPTTTETDVTNNTSNATEGNSSAQPIYKTFNYEFDNSYAFSSIYEMTKLTSNDVLPNEEVINTYDLSEFEDITFEVRKNSDYEVAVIKLKDTNQSRSLLSKVSARIQKLKVTEDEVAIEQNNGVLTLVIGKKASKVSELFTKQFGDI